MVAQPEGTDPPFRIEDTTVAGLTSCNGIQVELSDANGGVDSDILSDDSAVTWTVSTAGLYYIEFEPLLLLGEPGEGHHRAGARRSMGVVEASGG